MVTMPILDCDSNGRTERLIWRCSAITERWIIQIQIYRSFTAYPRQSSDVVRPGPVRQRA
jgi:hypothetical protein